MSWAIISRQDVRHTPLKPPLLWLQPCNIPLTSVTHVLTPCMALCRQDTEQDGRRCAHTLQLCAKDQIFVAKAL